MSGKKEVCDRGMLGKKEERGRKERVRQMVGEAS